MHANALVLLDLLPLLFLFFSIFGTRERSHSPNISTVQRIGVQNISQANRIFVTMVPSSVIVCSFIKEAIQSAALLISDRYDEQMSW